MDYDDPNNYTVLEAYDLMQLIYDGSDNNAPY